MFIAFLVVFFKYIAILGYFWAQKWGLGRYCSMIFIILFRNTIRSPIHISETILYEVSGCLLRFWYFSLNILQFWGIFGPKKGA